MDISLKTSRIYVVDQGVVKRIKYAGRAFNEVLEELQRFAYLRGYNTPTTILKFIIRRLGLPEVEIFPLEDDLTKEDILELSRALNTLDSLRDEYLSPLGSAEITEELKKYVTVITPATEDAMPVSVGLKPENLAKAVPQSEEAVELIYSFHWENLPVNTPTPRTSCSEDEGPQKKRFIWDDTSEMESLDEVTAQEEQVYEFTGKSHDLKVLFLGEQQVGVKSILFECNLKQGKDASLDDASPHTSAVYRDSIAHDDALVNLEVWSFEMAQRENIPRLEFFTGAGVAVIVYSVADRWSFDSLEFWIKELTNTFLVPPPVVIVGNKTDLRDYPVHEEDDVFEEPVTATEGEAFCQRIAKQLSGTTGSHPLMFLETSSVTGQGISDLLNTIVDLWFASERPSMPAMEASVIKR